MPMPRLNTDSISASAISPARWTSAKISGSRQRDRAMCASASGGSTRLRLPGSPPPVMCANACTSTPARNAREHRRVDHARPQQLVGQRSSRAGPGRVVERTTGAIEQRASRQRVAVAAQTRARDADDRVADRHVARQHLLPLDRADHEADEIELARRHQLRVLRHLAAEQRGARPGDTPRPPRPRWSPATSGSSWPIDR